MSDILHLLIDDYVRYRLSITYPNKFDTNDKKPSLMASALRYLGQKLSCNSQYLLKLEINVLSQMEFFEIMSHQFDMEDFEFEELGFYAYVEFVACIAICNAHSNICGDNTQDIISWAHEFLLSHHKSSDFIQNGFGFLLNDYHKSKQNNVDSFHHWYKYITN